MSLRNPFRFAAVPAGLLIAAVAMAQQAPTHQKAAVPSPSPSARQIVGKPNFGTTDLTYFRLAGLNFYPYQGPASQGYTTLGVARYGTTAGEGLEAEVHVPTGAIIDYLELDACDTNVTSDMSLSLLEGDPTSGSVSAIPATVTTTGSPGCVAVTLSGFGYQVDNSLHAISVEAIDNAADGSLYVAAAVVGYRLQVSPAPVTPTFTDVPTDSIYYQFIEALAASGVTGGCDVGLYCPDRNITRAEMAVFVAKSLGLHFPN